MEKSVMIRKDMEIQADLDLISTYQENNKSMESQLNRLRKIKSASRNKIIQSDRINKINQILSNAKLQNRKESSYKMLIVNSVLPSIAKSKVVLPKKKDTPQQLKGLFCQKQRNHSYYRFRNYFLSDIN